MDLVSVIIPTRDRWSYLEKTLGCLALQTSKEFEVIVVDDGSSDATLDGLELWRNKLPSLRVVRSRRAGAAACRNQGVEVSTGDFLVFLDSDDFLTETCLGERLRLMRESDLLDVAFFCCETFRELPGDLGRWLGIPDDRLELDRLLRLDYILQTGCAIWRKEALARVGGWDEAITQRDDWELFIRALACRVRYRWCLTRDCYWRLPDRARANLTQKSRRTDDNDRYLVDKVRRVLEENGAWNESRAAVLARVPQNWAAHRSEGSGNAVRRFFRRWLRAG